MIESVEAIVVGAGPAGLAAAAALNARGRGAVILEKSDAVASVWRRHYDRLHLHTDRARSSLPGLAMPTPYGRYPSRVQVVEYLEAYAAKFALKPVFNAPVRAVRRDGRAWRAEAGENSRSAPVIVVATGWADYPHAPTWPGIETFGGPVLHSSAYRNPAPLAISLYFSSGPPLRRPPCFLCSAPRSASRRVRRASYSGIWSGRSIALIFSTC